MAYELEQVELERETAAKRARQSNIQIDGDDFLYDSEVESNATMAASNKNKEQFATFDDGKGRAVHYCIPVREFIENGNVQGLVKFPVKTCENGRRRAITKKCNTYNRLTTFFV